MFRSYGGPTQRKVTSQRDRYLTSHTPEPHGRTSSRGFIVKVLTLSRQFIATIGTFEATRCFFLKSSLARYVFIMVLGNYKLRRSIGCRLDNGGIVLHSRHSRKFFCFPVWQTYSEAYPSSYSVGTGC